MQVLHHPLFQARHDTKAGVYCVASNRAVSAMSFVPGVAERLLPLQLY